MTTKCTCPSECKIHDQCDCTRVKKRNSNYCRNCYLKAVTSKNFCLDCGCEISKKASKCRKCSRPNLKGRKRKTKEEAKICIKCNKNNKLKGRHHCLNCTQKKCKNPDCEVYIIDKHKKYCSPQCCYDHRRAKKYKAIEFKEINSRKSVKKYLIDKHNFCKSCGIGPEYNGQPLTLELEHIDGDSSNNSLDNVCLLCPNCHSQTDTYRAKNTGNPKGKQHRRDRYRKSLKEA